MDLIMHRFILVSIVLSLRFVFSEIDDDAKFLPVEQFIKSRTNEIISFWGYPSEEHKVVTEDGYILTNFRMPNPGGYPILMLHGLSVSSDCWFLRNPKEDIVFLLWKKGYDIWFWNARGNMYSKEHESMNISDPNFYDFTFHEIGVYDTTATIDYILNVTGHKSVITIGHSMGTVNVMVAATMRPEYQKKVSLNVLWAQSAFIGHLKVRHILDTAYSIYSRWLNYPFAADFFVYGTEPVNVKTWYCSDKGPMSRLCIVGLRELSGPGSNQGNKFSAMKMLNRIPTGTSIWTIRQMIQNIRTGINVKVIMFASGSFRALNLGTERNRQKYGVSKMLPYPIGNMTVPTAIYYACCNDYLSSAKDAEILKKKLPNVVRYYEVPYKKFNHGDFLWAKDSFLLLYNNTIRLIDEHSARAVNKTQL